MDGEGELGISGGDDAAGRPCHRDGQSIRRCAGEFGDVVGDLPGIQAADIVQDSFEQLSDRFHALTISLRERDPSGTGSLSG